MSHCKACDSVLDKDVKWAALDKNYEGELPSCSDNLCAKCKNIAKMSLSASKQPFEDQARDIRRYFYSTWADSKDTDLASVMDIIEQDGSVGIDE